MYSLHQEERTTIYDSTGSVDKDNLWQVNSLGYFGWLRTLYIGMSADEFSLYLTEKHQIRLDSIIDGDKEVDMYNGNIDIFSNNNDLVYWYDSIGLLLPEVQNTLTNVPKSDTLNYLPAFTHKSFDFYEIDYENAPDMMRLFQHRTRAIFPKHLNDTISRATFWFQREKTNTSLFRVDLSFKDNSRPNIKEIIEGVSLQKASRNSVRYLDLMSNSFSGFAAENDKRFLVDDIYTVGNGEVGDGTIEQKRDDEIKRLIDDSTHLALQRIDLVELINAYNSYNDPFIKSKYCGEINKSRLKMLFAESEWMYDDIQDYLDESDVCNRHNKDIILSPEFKDLYNYYYLLEDKIDYEIDSFEVYRKQYIDFYRELLLFPYRKKGIRKLLDPSRFKKILDEPIIEEIISNLEDTDKTIYENTFFPGRPFRNESPDNDDFSGWLLARKNIDSVITEVGKRIDSLKIRIYNLDLMKVYYKGIIDDIDHKNYIRIDEEYCPLFQYYPLKNFPKASDSLAFYAKRELETTLDDLMQLTTENIDNLGSVAGLDTRSDKKITNYKDSLSEYRINLQDAKAAIENIPDLLQRRMIAADTILININQSIKYADSASVWLNELSAYQSQTVNKNELDSAEVDSIVSKVIKIGKYSVLTEKELNKTLKYAIKINTTSEELLTYDDTTAYFYETKPKYVELTSKTFVPIDSVFFRKLMALLDKNCLCSYSPDCSYINRGKIDRLLDNFHRYVKAIDIRIDERFTKLRILRASEKKARYNKNKTWSYSEVFGEGVQLIVCWHSDDNNLAKYYEQQNKPHFYPSLSVYDRKKLTEWLELNKQDEN
ncbi:MAG: hypothetical protein AAFQ94_19675 [Bacteroidota bacterium]